VAIGEGISPPIKGDNMRHNLPSVKTLQAIAGDRAKELMSILEISKRSELESVLEKYPSASKWYHACYNPMDMHVAKMAIADEILGTYGIEYCRGSRSFAYLNTGDSYAATLIRFFDGQYRVSDWGTIVEKGRYE